MGDAYTPGLTVTPSTIVRRKRRLPLSGTVRVTVGQRVNAEAVIAETELPGRVHPVNIANRLGVNPDEVATFLRVQPGDQISKGQLLGERRSLFGLVRTALLSPIDGTFESVSSVTGQAMLREPPRPVDVSAYIDGEVVEVADGEGATVQAHAALIQGIFGLGGETRAPLKTVATDPAQPLEPDQLSEACRGHIVVGGGRMTLPAVRRAIELGVKGVVAGGIAYQDIKELLGYDVGVAVTGTEQLGATLMVTEGFGDIAMARATFDLLRRHEGEIASMDGATQIRAGVIRPELVIPFAEPSGQVASSVESSVGAEAAPAGLVVGASVRCIRAPHFGRIGTVAALPVELVTMPSETKVRVVEVEVPEVGRITVPRANVEVISGASGVVAAGGQA